MASGYRNSANTDLDDIFFVNDSGLGGVGFLTSSGTDIGNRYRGGTLGYSVGYVGYSGTDIGFLRGTLSAPGGTASIGTSNVYHNLKDASATTNGVTEYSIAFGATLTPQISTNGQEVTSATFTLQYQFRTGTSYTVWVKCNANSSTVPSIPLNSGTVTPSNGGYDKTYWVGGNSHLNKWQTLATYNSANLSAPASVFVRTIQSSIYTGNRVMDFRFLITLYNEAGSASITSSTFTKILNVA